MVQIKEVKPESAKLQVDPFSNVKWKFFSRDRYDSAQSISTKIDDRLKSSYQIKLLTGKVDSS